MSLTQIRGQIKKNNSRGHNWRVDNLPFIHFGPKKLVIKKMARFFEINIKRIIIQGDKTNYFLASSAILAILKAPAEDATS